MSVLEIVGLAATILSILGVIVGVAVRLATSPLQTENANLHNQIKEIAESQARLVESLTLLKTASSDAQSQKAEIDQELRYLAQMAGVNSASALIPYPPGQKNRLVFLSVVGPESNKLKHVYVNISSSVAGEVYLNGRSLIVNNTQSNKKWNPTADKRSAFTTNNLLCLPLNHGDQIVGVAQFINRPDGFNEEIRDTLEKAIVTLAFKISKFTQRVDNLEILGLGYAQDIEDGTVILVDMSASSSLLKGAHPLPKTDVISLISFWCKTQERC